MNLTCQECGKIQELNFQPDTNEDLASHNLCWTCNFWKYTVLEQSKGLTTFTFENKHYALFPNIPKEITNKKYKIIFSPSHIEQTNKIKCFGEVPERFRPMYPNNAVLEEII